MKLKKIPTATILALVSFTGTAVFAQVGAAATSATSAATNTAATTRAPAPSAVNPPTTPAVNAPLPSVNPPTSTPNPAITPASSASTINSSVPAASSTVNGSTNTSANSTAGAIDSSLSSSAAATGDVSRDRINADARSNVNTAGQVNSLATGSDMSAGLSASLNPANTVRDIRGATFDSREALSSQVNSNLDSSAKSLAEIRRAGRELKGDARSQFNAAYDDVQAKEKTLKRSLNDARRSSSETWSNSQAKLASDYEAYAAAVARAEAAAAASASASGSTSTAP